MSINNLAKAMVPVMLGVFAAGYAMYALRDVQLVAEARAGYGG